MTSDVQYAWSPKSMLEITLATPDNFLKVRETLTRIGVASKKDNTLYQSCHILHKQGRYYLVHFKEMFNLDSKQSDISVNDIERRNTIAGLLQDWNLLTIVDQKKAQDKAPISQIKIVSFVDKPNWKLVPKYSIGTKTKEDNVKSDQVGTDAGRGGRSNATAGTTPVSGSGKAAQ
jgi:hypothetical protein